MLNFTHPNPAPLSEAAINSAANILAVKPAHIWAVLQVETSGCGVTADRRPVIRYERHHFSRLTSGRWNDDHPAISSPTMGGYGSNVAMEYGRLALACTLDQDAALQATSWGIGQVMGFNFRALGCLTVEQFVTEAVQGENTQLVHMAQFIEHSGLQQELQQRDWVGFARAYNGPNFAKNCYDMKLSKAFERLTAVDGLPDMNVRAVQLWLRFIGYKIAVDGVMGSRTVQALIQYQRERGLEATGTITQETMDLLKEAVPAC